MRGIVGGLFLIGVVVMAYCGRVTWLSGGGVVMPQLSATSLSSPSGPMLRLTNTGSDTLKQIEISLDRWNLNHRQSVCAELPPGQEVLIPLPLEAGGKSVYVFAASYPLPAWFEVGK